MPHRRKILWGSATLALVVAGTLLYQVDWTAPGKPICHKALFTVLWGWQDDSGTTDFPNALGRSTDSLAQCDKLLQSDESKLSGNYMYVPGLTRDDPGELVLLYMAKPTRWTWHGEWPLRAAPLRWLVVPVDFREGNREFNGKGEQSQQLTDDQFFSRLEKTLRFVEENKRPNWESIVKEHRAFLDEVRKQQVPN